MLLNLSVIFSDGEAARTAGTLDIADAVSRTMQVLVFAVYLWRSWPRARAGEPRLA
jgi:hypothetical protein